MIMKISPIVLLVLTLFAPALAAQDAAVEIHTQDFYDGITITTMKLPNGDFQALVSTPAENAPSDAGDIVRARYTLRKARREGVWQVVGDGRAKPRETVYEYARGSYPRALDEILDDHNVYSITLSALLLWEEELAARSTPNPLFDRKVFDFNKTEVEVCDDCTAEPNGCSPGWIIPDSCAGSSITIPCNDHDICYQCFGPCHGTTRLECDRGLHDDILETTGSSLCANIYYYGVRMLGWVFYNDPRERENYGPDVYSLGIEISACSGQYAHMCTTFAM